MRNKIRILLYEVITLMAYISCTHPQDKALEEALQLAGKNRTESENVLTHYQNSPIKLLPYGNRYDESTGKCLPTNIFLPHN